MLSISANFLVTAVWRSAYAFVIVFAVIYVFRWLFGTAAGLKQFEAGELAPGAADVAGAAVDLSTPQDEDLNDLLKAQLAEQSPDAPAKQFEPLELPKLASKDKLDPELLAESLRHMSEK